jgi:hypothetical protein
VFLPFLFELRARGVPVGTTEAVQLAKALKAGLHEQSLDGFYHVSRAILIHREGHLDDFDQAFLKVFKGVEVAAKKIQDDLLEWLKKAAPISDSLTEEERALLENLDPAELEKLFEERMREQKERHDGGNKWVGTAGTSPFGHSGKAARQGIRVGGPGGGRSAIKTADARLYQGYRQDLTLDVRQMQVALRKLRTFARAGGDEELDLEGTIAATSKNAGELEVVVRPPRRPNTRVILMMDVGGSMDPFALLCSRLFSAAKKSTHFKELRTYYFHNCIYGRVYETERFTDPVRITDLLHDCGPHYKLIVVGDALMAPYELMSPGGALSYEGEERAEGITWLMRLRNHFRKSVWLNPEPPLYWEGNTIENIRGVFDMYPLTLEGLGEAMAHLLRGR